MQRLTAKDIMTREILAVQVDEKALTADGLIDYDQVRAIACLGNEYHRIGDCLNTEGFSLHEPWPPAG